MKILGIESSCDETAASVVEDGRTVLSNIVASQVEEHKIYGGVVPEIASRRHTEAISGVVRAALGDAGCTIRDIDAVAVTYAPGLIGALLVGVNFAKGLSYSSERPLVPVHHLRSHIASNYISHTDLKPPFLCLVVSGGHSHIIEVKDYTDFKIIGYTHDDAAGEAMDKAARAMGMPGADKPEDFLTALAELQKACGVDNLRMSDYGITKEECDTLARNARETMGGLFAANPCEMTHEDCADIFEKSYR